MNTYLAIITTVLVLTQIIRLIQNAIQLHRQNKKFTKDLEWIKNNDISERDFDVQRKCFYLLRDYLEREMNANESFAAGLRSDCDLWDDAYRNDETEEDE